VTTKRDRLLVGSVAVHNNPRGESGGYFKLQTMEVRKMNILNRKPILRMAGISIAALLLATGLSTTALAGESANQDDWQDSARDAWIDGKIEASYTLNQYLNPFTIDTRVEDGVVMLTGKVESQIDKDLAGEIALGIDGVTEVRNELAVVSGTRKPEDSSRDFGDYVSDVTVTARVKYALVENSSTDGLSINVDTKAAKVTLNGEVESAQVKELAERIASNVEGVAGVDNRLKITGQS